MKKPKMKKPKKFWHDYDQEYKAALNALHKHAQIIGWKSMSYMIERYQNNEEPDNPYNLKRVKA